MPPRSSSSLVSLRPKPRGRRGSIVTGVQRFGIAKWSTYVGDPFHSLLNLPWWKFVFVFFSTYVLQFCTFALVYLAFPDSCISGIDGHFSHALWMSSRVASTIGFTQIYPQTTCAGANLIVMLQVICSSLIDFCMLGLVFARFSAPFKRATSIRFSRVCTVARLPPSPPSAAAGGGGGGANSVGSGGGITNGGGGGGNAGYWALTFRVANIRKHQLLKPEIRVVMTAVDSITPSDYVFEYLAIEQPDMQAMNLQLGFPANVTHVIKPGSPLWHLSLQEMDARMMDVVVLFDGVDSMTSRALQARNSYAPSDMLLNERFADLHLEMRGGKLGLDFKHFDATTPIGDDSGLQGMSMPEAQQHISHLRHQTFKRLYESANRGSAAAAAAAAAAGAGGGGAGALSPAGVAGGRSREDAAAAGWVAGLQTVELGRI